MGLCKRVIPVMLVKGQTLVKGQRFNPWRSIGHPVQAARVHARRGVDELMIMDVSATAEGRGPDLDLVRQLSEDCYVPITVGGGVKTLHDIDALLRAGADKVAYSLSGPSHPAYGDRLAFTMLASERFGAQALVGIMNVDGGRIECGGPTVLAKLGQKYGIGEILLQCVERDGMMQGYDLDLIKAVTDAVSVPVIASCGAGTYEHMHKALQAGADAVAAGAMFSFTEATPKGASQYLKAKGWEMRA